MLCQPADGHRTRPGEHPEREIVEAGSRDAQNGRRGRSGVDEGALRFEHRRIGGDAPETRRCLPTGEREQRADDDPTAGKGIDAVRQESAARDRDRLCQEHGAPRLRKVRAARPGQAGERDGRHRHGKGALEHRHEP